MLKISVVTPSYNQGPFLEETIRSVLDQEYPNLEYLVMDGGSTDNSAEILRRYGSRLAYWVSEPDGGMYDAINRGFARSTGEVMTWINSDDKLMPWSLRVAGELFGQHARLEWISSLFPTCMAQDGCISSCRAVEGYTRHGFMRGENLPMGHWHATGFLQQEGTFWRRSLWERCGGRLEASLQHAGDFDLWARFFAQGAELYGVPVPMGAFRLQPEQKTALHLPEYLAEAEAALRRHGGRPFGRLESFLMRKAAKLSRYLQTKYRGRLCGTEPFRRFYWGREGWQPRPEL